MFSTPKKLALLLTMGLLSGSVIQAQSLTAPADGGNKRASISERIGLTEITITYDRPALKGRDGKIWGQLVHFGLADLGFGTSKAAPWRAGANENTVFSTSTAVKIEGKTLLAGKYGLFMAVYADSVAVIFSKNSTSWGSYFYDAKEDALRVSVKPLKDQPLVERLKYEFEGQTDNSATVALSWERRKIPFRVEADVHNLVLASFRNELRNDKGFGWQAWNQAAQYALQNNVNLDEGLKWAENAVSMPFFGTKNFTTLSTKAGLLSKLNRQAEADAAMKEALPFGTMQELHAFGRSLLAQKKGPEALDVFKLNAQKNPNQFTTNMGLTRGYSAIGDFKNALKFAKAAQPQAPDKINRDNLDRLIAQLGEGKDINQ
ncbi:MAG: DUF2911 domain-containing protein [Cytophagaceae bacterium]|nr:DUF2911 domain-containing protein [Cytophagaceae bacterium]